MVFCYSNLSRLRHVENPMRTITKVFPELMKPEITPKDTRENLSKICGKSILGRGKKCDEKTHMSKVVRGVWGTTHYQTF